MATTRTRSVDLRLSLEAPVSHEASSLGDEVQDMVAIPENEGTLGGNVASSTSP